MLKKIDFLFFGYVFITTILLFFSWNQSTNSFNLLLVRGFIVLGVISLLFLNSKIKSNILELLRNIYPIIIGGYFYSETVFYNKFIWQNLDQKLIDLDQLIFGFQPSVAFSEILSHKFFSELMYFGYFSFYLLITAFVIIAYYKLKEETTELIFKFSAAMLLFYLFFGVVPSAGPQFYLSSPEKDLPVAFIFDKIMHFIQANAEQPTAAFPSSHVGISIIILILLRKKVPLFFRITIPFVILLILSTVYIKAHYAIDVIGGIIFAPIMLYLASVLYKIPIYNKKPKF
ncbi:phosphatase PAP2 family protein [Tenacibaculum haliotis]|uniref:phosphatase PAP2 family protein n=1 Tax=Tenacibaculum haliotis TaxID=1888914 RepID=UPI0021AFA8BF|nr:phosphatase PAP2 family protein [Tenacibaculum haliotis]MCT4698900.1 phosphatase PAP2 family protein [Tenacibaculum haliotis]